MVGVGDRRGRSAAARSRLPGLAALVVVVLALTACVSLPTRGPVSTDEEESGPDAAGVRAVAPAPGRGESPAGIVGNFLLAVTGDDLEVARSYLTPDAAASWRPTDRTVVYDNALDLQGLPGAGPAGGADAVSPASGRLRVSAEIAVVAEVDAQGHYRPAAPGAREEVSLTLERTADRQWRIAELADQLLLNEATFARFVRQVTLYFPDPTGRYLVPDVRWFAQRSSLPTTVAAALLAGPSDWLRPAVGTVTPAGTELAMEAVVVSSGVARVELSEQVLQTGPEQRSVLQAQLDATLLPLPGVGTVRLLVDGARLAQTARPSTLEQDPVPDAQVTLLGAPGGHGVVQLSSGGPAPVAGVPVDEAVDPSRLAVAYEEGVYAVLTDEGTELRLLLAGDEASRGPVLTGPALSGPSFDRYGFVWSAAGDRVAAVRTSAEPSEPPALVDADWLTGRRVSVLRLSRDGSRAAVVSSDRGGRVRVEVTGVARDDDGIPTRLVPAPGGSLVPSLTTVDDVAWLGESGLVVLTTAPGGGSGVVVVTVVGPAVRLADPAATAESVTAGRTPQSVVLGTTDGRVLTRAGAGWTEAFPSGTGRWPALPG